MNKPHKHAAMIKAWADGAEIEYMNSIHGWMKVEMPTWDVLTEYRVFDPYRKLKEAQAQGKAVEFSYGGSWYEASILTNTPNECLFAIDKYRIKPEPTTLTIQCWMDSQQQLHWTNTKPGKAQWKRVPAEDKVVEVLL